MAFYVPVRHVGLAHVFGFGMGVLQDLAAGIQTCRLREGGVVDPAPIEDDFEHTLEAARRRKAGCASRAFHRGAHRVVREPTPAFHPPHHCGKVPRFREEEARRLRLQLTLTQYILVGLALGLIVGLTLPEVGSALSILSVIFIRLLQMMVVPLVFSTLVVGVAGAKGGGSFKRLALRTVVFFLVATTVAALLGIAFTNMFKPGLRGEATVEMPASAPAPAQERPSLVEMMIPTSIFQAFHGNNLMALVLFTVAFGFALRAVSPKGDLILKGCEALAAIMFRLTEYVMWVAPLGVLGAMAATVARTGFEGLGPFLALLFTSYLAEAVFVLVFFTGVSIVFRFSLIRFLKKLSDALLLAYTTASGAAALPAAMERLEEWGASRRVVSFVLPLGYSFNLTGIALYLPMVTLFWAQFNGVSFSWDEQAVLLAYVLVVIRGLPPVPRGFFLIWASLLARFDLPPEGLVILLAVDPLIDMARTIVNVGGNCLAVAALDRWEKASGDQET